MSKSILQSRRECYICREMDNVKTERQLERHHVFGGPLRPISEQYGLTVYLCRRHHREQNGYSVHFHAPLRKWLQSRAFAALSQQEGEERAQEILGKDYADR